MTLICITAVSRGCGARGQLTRGQRHESPPEAVNERPLQHRRVFFGEEDQAAKGEHCDSHKDYKETELLVSLLESIQETLQSSKVAHKLKDAQYAHNASQTHDLACLAQDVQVLKALYERGNNVWQDGQKVHKIHQLQEKETAVNINI